jgi:hyperosmotically inducible protein
VKLSANGRRLSEKADDAAITAAVSARLAGDPDLSALRIDVDTRDGKVTLSGPAPTEAARARAAELATSVKGVLGIDNKLVVKAG